MNFDNPIVWIISGVACLLILAVLFLRFFTEEARIERRRRKSNSRLISNARKPMVKFSVKPPRDD